MTKADVKLICDNDQQMRWWAMVLFSEICELADATISDAKGDDRTFASLVRGKVEEFPRLVVQNQLDKFKKLEEESVDEDYVD